jgi:hypothetical protein
MFTRKTVDEKTKSKVIQLEETVKALEARLLGRIEELEKQILELSIKQRRDDGFFKMIIETIKEWSDKDE